MDHKRTKTILKVFFGGMSLAMVWLVIDTSLKSNLFEVLPQLNAQPWFNTTMVDFYFNIAIISAWVIYKEKSLLAAILWVISFILLGSITTALYVLVQLLKLKEEEPAETILRKA